MKQKFVLLFLSILLALLVGEMVLWFYFRYFPDYDIEMWRYALELKRGVDEDRSHVHVPNSSSILMGVPVQINSKGLRDYEYAYEKPAGTYRILVLGDSITFGWGVAFEKTFSKRLEVMLRSRNNQTRKYAAIEVINAGIGNYNTKQELAYLEQEGVRYEPDEVLLAYYLNDAEITQKEVDNPFGARKSVLWAFSLSLKNKILAIFDARRRYNFYCKNLYAGKQWKEHQGTLFNFVEKTRERGIRLTVLILPEFHDFQDYPFLDIHKKIADFFQEQECLVWDALEAFHEKEAGKFWVARDDPHPNTEANQMIADFVFNGIKNRF